MVRKIEIHTIQMVREIRDDHSKILNKKSHQEIIDFYKNGAKDTKLKLQQIGFRILKKSANQRMVRTEHKSLKSQ
jgi:hypothetical protein